jgi:hypothetical protein
MARTIRHLYLVILYDRVPIINLNHTRSEQTYHVELGRRTVYTSNIGWGIIPDQDLDYI